VNQLFDPEVTAESGRFIGMDEAGYGPNLGPLVITSTTWETPDSPAECKFEALLKDVIDTKSTCRKTKLHIADSKLVNKGKYGFESLETSALALLNAAGMPVSTFQELRQNVCGFNKTGNDPFNDIPWFVGDMNLPFSADAALINSLADSLKQTFEQKKIGCLKIQAEVVPAIQFNSLLDQHGSKGILLTTLAFSLLKKSWEQRSTTPILFVGDKHGGRNHYGEFLASIAPRTLIETIEEGQSTSRYRVSSTEFRFQTKGEEHLPVAAASIVAKYIRELSMYQFNSYWQQFCKDVKPTKGYPVDAKRFWQEIKTAQHEQRISDDQLWRKR
jgi:ribonuclease HII